MTKTVEHGPHHCLGHQSGHNVQLSPRVNLPFIKDSCDVDGRGVLTGPATFRRWLTSTSGCSSTSLLTSLYPSRVDESRLDYRGIMDFPLAATNRSEWGSKFQQQQILEMFPFPVAGQIALTIIALIVWQFHRCKWVSSVILEHKIRCDPTNGDVG